MRSQPPPDLKNPTQETVIRTKDSSPSTISGNGTDAINLIAQDMKSLVKKIQDLRHIGIEDNRIALPKICVIGDQSTGKSSLIEGMSEIKVPRSSGTCTRCPMEINLTESKPGQPWICRVFLSRKYMFDGSRKVTKLPKKSQPLGPWILQDQEDELFVTLSDKCFVQDAIMWAQVAILNPSQPSIDYVPGRNADASMNCQVKFSPNVVRLDISAPSFPNLSFYDLPGVISQAEFDEERYLVSLVENLAKEYISQENCIVLLTLPMTDDATNSSAARLMRDVRGAKERTLGVLTKPDRVQACESYNQWMEILEGDKFALGHGYYVVQNNPDPSVDHAQARDEEADFFTRHPWSTELQAYKDRFGTRNLQSALSMLLLERIQGCLPRIIEQIDAKAARIDDELRTLPDPPSANVQYILCRKISQLKERITAHFNGGSSQYPLQKIWGHLALDFKTALIKTRPTVQLRAGSDAARLGGERDGESDCEMTGVQNVTPVKRKTPGDGPTSTPNLPDVNGAGGQVGTPKTSVYFTTHFHKFDKPARMFTWEEIREINEDAYRAGIPDQADPKAIEIMRQLSVRHWNEPMLVFLQATHSLVREMLMKQLEDVFTQYRQTSLYRELRKIIDTFLRGLQKEHIRHAQENYDIECHKPFTMATTTLEQVSRSAYQFLSTRRNEARVHCALALRGISAEHPRRDYEMKRLVLPADDFTQELKMMASTRGYYEIASSRFIDFTCQSVHTKLFSKCRDELITVIEEELGIVEDNAFERCQELMAEDPERQHRRQYLLREKEKITKAQEWLDSVKREDDAGEQGTVFVKSQPPDEWASFPVFPPTVSMD
ncbi:hypothetical protein EYZ11_001637 [Aspergillus tanneri]|uniref:GED domain-containing protein n=1 Tax=Aspergillus tanneri TaxID=1220188 RepID=A0A4S3JSN9_9EURO|nr:uncharacterized protein ATNIH1004_008525 [Aspergillus tanneri]KAA8644324.1 hypothetical protein ATNIH1004_008525 [Aspergillus tanneri]THC98859.1 hypothetical protein EYZ11_001637 [Aspergillus tanneri]